MAANLKIWIDLANSPHVQVFGPVVRRLRDEGHSVLLTARDHAQTTDLARRQWVETLVIGEPSPATILAKGRAIAGRAARLRGFAVHERPEVALSHGSYAQILAARAAGVPSVTMMDYEHQPANHVSFRLANQIVVPSVFPEDSLRRFGASSRKTLRFPGFKEELYLAGFRPDSRVLDELGLDRESVIAVLRPPPRGALYHRKDNERFDELLRVAVSNEYVQTVVLPRTPEQAERYRGVSDRVRCPQSAIDGCSLLALADLVIGAGGTMNRESALLGTPTYTVFGGHLAAVDGELIRTGRLTDLRTPGTSPRFDRKARPPIPAPDLDPEPILAAVMNALDAATTHSG